MGVGGVDKECGEGRGKRGSYSDRNDGSPESWAPLLTDLSESS